MHREGIFSEHGVLNFYLSDVVIFQSMTRYCGDGGQLGDHELSRMNHQYCCRNL